MSDSTLPSIRANASDHLAAALKGIAGAAPVVGGAIAELVGAIIPNQRLDRVARFATALEERLSDLEARHIQGELSDERFSDLLEDALQQAARATSTDRIEQLAEIVSRSLTADDISHGERKHLMRILSELTDIEVIWLGSFLNSYIGEPSEFQKRHKDVLQPRRAFLGAPQPELDKSTLQGSYKAHLAQLGLLDRSIQLDRNKQPEIDGSTGDFKVRSYRITRLGKLLLREIGLDE